MAKPSSTRRSLVIAICKEILPKGIVRQELPKKVILSRSSDGQYTITQGLGTLGVTKCTFYDLTPMGDFVWKIAAEMLRIDYRDEEEEDKRQVRKFRKNIVLTYGISDKDKSVTMRAINRLISKKDRTKIVDNL